MTPLPSPPCRATCDEEYTVHPTSPAYPPTQMINHYDALGVNFRPIRQSEGATLILERGISRRLVGLPLSASVANFRMAPRPVGWPGAQSVEPLSDFIYNSTRGPAPVAALAGAVRVTDFATTVSRRRQGLSVLIVQSAERRAAKHDPTRTTQDGNVGCRGHPASSGRGNGSG